MAILSGLGLAAKLSWLESMRGDKCMLALYDASASLSPVSMTYTPANEVKGQGYSAGGQALQGYECGVSAMSAVATWTQTVVWKNATIRARGAVIYNASKGNIIVAVIDFGQDVTSTNGDYKVRIPPDVLKVS